LTVFSTDRLKGGEGGGSESRIDEKEDHTHQHPCPNPDLPWPQSGETLLPGWGTRVSMEYRLRVASEDECLAWANSRWELELVAKARHHHDAWAVNILRNRAVWAEVPAARAERRAANLDQFKRVGSWQPPESEAPEHFRLI
jgi:hypothetical protein